MQSVCVFCGSSPGLDPAFAASAAEVGRLLAESGRALVYGGGHVGLMGVVADAALRAGGRVVGVIPRSLMDREVGHLGLTELRVVGSMHERKALMADLADGFLALPGGIGTLEEFFETWTWAQLGLHAKPFGLLDVHGFYGPLLAFLDRLVEQRFVRQEHRDMLLVGREPGPLLSRMQSHRPASPPKWIDRGQA
ncbi:LOG family protein [Tautonia plasticadhaerens]|uniref:Cytokinin riboside 5'-monophosphate phosphoribohydrolase n=1 Tax=Tautonia plasticadhaerens TaxID=2527974 RepID=A0A518H370_9BACT|nr:TIGR00730 family Rossman fold protein [Tautonia plasticadhaerens]QDV35284.1 LOG family protein YvdD [Tautonia plasticadhaerens]